MDGGGGSSFDESLFGEDCGLLYCLWGNVLFSTDLSLCRWNLWGKGVLDTGADVFRRLSCGEWKKEDENRFMRGYAVFAGACRHVA